MSETDEHWMDMALAMAQKGRPSPNPHVGAVVVRNGKLISKGHHTKAGSAHAEVVALRKAGTLAHGATLYVTLAPCDHQGRTGPCSEAVLASGVRRVVVGCKDPTPGRGDGVGRLRRAGLDVRVGVRRAAAEALIADYRKHVRTGLPHVTLKAAVSLDGRIATRTGDSRWITGAPARREAHRMRAACDAVMVGIGTVLADDPALTVRSVRGSDPIRVVLDSRLRIAPTSKLLRHASRAPTWIAHGPAASAARRRKLEDLPAVELIEVATDRQGRVRLPALLALLARRGVVRLLVEGGGTLHGALLDANLVDEAAVFVAPCIVGGAGARSMAEGLGVARMAQCHQLRAVQVRSLGRDLLIRGALDPAHRKR